MENTNKHGSIRVSDEVVADIAVKSTREVDGVAGVNSSLLDNAFRFVSSKGKSVRGVNIVVVDGALELTIPVTVRFGCRIQDVCVAVQSAVAEAVTDMTGFEVRSVNVAVVGIAAEKAAKPAEKK